MPITNDILRVLETAQCDGPLVYFPELTDSFVYERVDQILNKAGATWSFRHEAYLFADLFPAGQAAALIEKMITLRRVLRPEDRGVVSCPQAVAERMCEELADRIGPGAKVLEPSAGHGMLAAEAAARGADVDCYELDAHRARDIRRAKIARRVTTADVLTVTPRPRYDVVVMYPPYQRQIAAAHIVHAHRFLRPGGALTALVSRGLQHARGAVGHDLRSLWARGGWQRIELRPGEVQSPTGLAVLAEIWVYRGDQGTDAR